MFRLLGPLVVELDGEVLPIGGQRPRAVLTALLLQPNHVVSTSRLVDLLWDEAPPVEPGNALHQVVARLRRQLGPLSETVVTRPPGYLIQVQPAAVDTELFEAGCRGARTMAANDPVKAAAQLREVLGLWRGPAYGEFAEGFARAAATRLEEQRRSAQEDLTGLELEAGQVAESVASASSLVASEPLRERGVQLLMRALHADGRAAEALDVFDRYRHRLAEEAGLDPTPELRALQADVLRDDLAVVRRRPPTATQSRPALPYRPGGLVGREVDLRLLLTCVPNQRLLSVVGPGGVGKTRLALEVAHELAGAGTMVWWADLSTTAPERLGATIGEAVGVELPSGRSAAESLGIALGAHRGVVCLDNAETVLSALAPVAEHLIGAAPLLHIVITSRERLAAADEHVHLLSPLPLPAAADRDNAAIRLFVDRAPGLERGGLSDDDVALVADVCRRLDGLPLALELGAARVPAFGLRELARQLDRNLDLLVGGRRSAAARHQTMRAVVEWSYGLLASNEMHLLPRLTVFPGAFSLDQVQSICGDETLPAAMIPASLFRLVEQSLVQAGEGRFWLLDTLRTHARERLPEIEAHTLRSRHAEHTAARLDEIRRRLYSRDEVSAARELAGMTADLHAAWANAVESDHDLAVRLAADVSEYAYRRQQRDLLDWGTTVAGWNLRHPLSSRALATAAAAAWADGRLAEAEDLAMRGVAAVGPDDPLGASALSQLANIQTFSGRMDDARSGYRRVAALLRSAGQPVGALLEELAVAQTLVYEGRINEALELLPALVAEAQESACLSAVSWAMYVSGLAAEHTDPSKAATAYAQAVEAAEAADSQLFLMLARSSALALAARLGPPAQALEEFDRVLNRWEELRNVAIQWWVLLHLVALLVRLDRLFDAARLAGAVLRVRNRRVSFAPDEILLANAVAELRTLLGVVTAEATMDAGAQMSAAEALAHARDAITAAREAV